MEDNYKIRDLVRCKGAGFDGKVGYIVYINKGAVYPYEVYFNYKNKYRMSTQTLNKNEITRIYYNNR